jgi:hypothetical protein
MEIALTGKHGKQVMGKHKPYDTGIRPQGDGIA